MSAAEFKKYILQRPTAVNDKKQLLAILKDAMRSDKKKYHALYQVYEAGILDVLKISNPPSNDERRQIIKILTQQYALAQQAAEFAVDFWVESLDGFSFENIGDLNGGSFMALPQNKEGEDALPGPRLITISYNPLRKEVLLQWKRQQEAESYEVWRSVGEQRAELIKQGTFPLPRFADKEIISGELHTYVIRSKRKAREEKTLFSNILQISVPQESDSFEIGELRVLDDAVQLRWNYLVDVSQYLIKRKGVEESDWKTIAFVPNVQFTYVDKDVINETQYVYQVECQRRNHSALISHEVALTL